MVSRNVLTAIQTYGDFLKIKSVVGQKNLKLGMVHAITWTNSTVQKSCHSNMS